MQNKGIILKKEQYNAIDLAKFLCAILVVMVHISPLGVSDKFVVINTAIQDGVARIAVPFFFIASGFFLYKKTSYDNFDMKPTKKYVIKILKLYIIWTIIYLPISIQKMIASGNNIYDEIFLYIRNSIFKGSYSHLWYLPATIIGVLILSFCISKRIKIKHILFLAAILYIIGLFAQSWFVVIKPISVYAPTVWTCLKVIQAVIFTTRNGVFDAFPFLCIGMLFAYRKIEIDMKKAVLGFFAFGFLLVVEAITVKTFRFSIANDMYIFLVPTAFFFFYIAKNINLKNNDIYIVLRKLSSLIFYLHLLVDVTIVDISKHIFLFDISATCLEFAITLVITILLSLLIIKLSECKHFTWLKKIYC